MSFTDEVFFFYNYDLKLSEICKGELRTSCRSLMNEFWITEIGVATPIPLFPNSPGEYFQWRLQGDFLANPEISSIKSP